MISPYGPKVAVVGLSFGDEGKGTITDHLTAEYDYDLVVKSSGAAQCAHHVVREDGSWHRFAQFGSGTFNGARTFLSKFFMVDPLRLAAEADALEVLGVRDPLSLMCVDERCLITTPYHAAANRAKEILRGDAAHGSCGVGVGETMAYDLDSFSSGLRVRDIVSATPGRLNAKLRQIQDHYSQHLGRVFWDELRAIPNTDVPDLEVAYQAFAHAVQLIDRYDADRMIRDNAVVFEGSQGVLLDEWYGMHPFTTWSTTTFENADALADGEQVYHLGVLRAYTTRHGAGPFPTELEPHQAPQEAHNGTGRFQGAWRAGRFDAVLARYALEVCGGVDGLALTHLDHFDRDGQAWISGAYCDGYLIDGMKVTDLFPKDRYDDLEYQERMGAQLARVDEPLLHSWPPASHPEDVIPEILGVPLDIASYGPKNSDKRVMRECGSPFSLSA